MPRDIPVGNDSFLITFDQDYCLRDIYFPYLGKENHTDGHKFRFGVWVEGNFRWVNRNWNLKLEYAEESLLTHVTAFIDVNIQEELVKDGLLSFYWIRGCIYKT